MNCRCEQMIRTAPTSVAQKAMADFSLADRTTNVSGQFAFLFKRRLEMAEEQGPLEADRVTQFVQKWGMDSRCEQMIRTAPTSVAQKAMADFSPAEGTTNVSGRFASFFKQGKVVWK